MGDRYNLTKECIYCGNTNDEVYYAPTCGFLTFICDKCKKENFITTDFKVKKIEDVTKKDVYWAISNASNMMDEKMIKECTNEFYNKLKGEKQNG